MSRVKPTYFRLLALTCLSAAPLLAWGCGGDPELDGGNGGKGSSTGDGDGSGTIGFGGGLGAGSSNGTGSGSTNGAGASGNGSCNESNEAADLVPANLLFVVDKSGSMNCNAPPIDNTCSQPQKVESGEPSKWEITQEALTGDSGALQTLAGQAGISVGLIAFPTDNYCGVPDKGDTTVPLAPLTSDQLSDLTDGLTLTADGQTPLAGATIRGLNALDKGLEDGELPGKNYLVVMTDGAETCQPDAVDDVLSYIKTAREELGILTYAIGAPGSEGSRALLSKMAKAGGTQKSDTCKDSPTKASESCHIDLTESTDFEGDLGKEFKGITEATTQSCEYAVPSNALIDKNKVNVEYTPTGGKKELILQDPPQKGKAQCEDAEGWQFSEDGSQIILCGSVCDDVLADPGAKVRVVFGCRDTEIVVR